MPNNFAYLVLLLWPFIVIYLLNRFNIGKGTLLSLLGGYMFLPAYMKIDLPILPPLDKFTITTLTIMTFMVVRKIPFGINLLQKHYKYLLLISLIAPFFTAITNSERYLRLPGLSLYDGLTNSAISFLYFFPFLIGVKYFRDEKSHIKLFEYFAVAALIYSFFALYEIRMSPQLNSMIYGYFPHTWGQQYRDGGFRAVVFMGHGLLVAMFLALGLAFWGAMQKSGLKIYKYNSVLGLFVILIAVVLMKTYSAFIYGFFAFIAIRYFRDRQLLRISTLIALLFLSYPILSSLGLFPHNQIISFVESINPERAQSLDFRFENENSLLAHANEKPIFGWGGWGRNRIFDPDTLEDISVTDGYWVIILGTSGWVGFLSKFLFFFLPIWSIFRITKNKQIMPSYGGANTLLSAHALILSLIMLDQLPNSSLSDNALYWLLAGSLLGRSQELHKLNQQA